MSNNIANADTPSLPYYVATYKSRLVAIKRDADYQSTIKLVQKSIPKLRLADAENIFISTKLADFGDALVQISEEIWPDMVAHLKTVEITLEDQTDAGHPTSQRVHGEDENIIPGQQGEHVAIVATAANSASEHIPSQATAHQAAKSPANTSSDPRKVFSISVRTTSQALLELSDLRPSSTISDLKSLIEMAYRVPAVLQRLDLHGQPLDDAKTLKQCKISDWTILDLYLNARQYMIYLYPDLTLPTSERFRHWNVKVKLSLNRSWELADLPPLREAPLDDYAQSVSWTVDVAPGALLDKGSNVELTCLYWDGISQPAQVITSASLLSQSQVEPYPSHGWPRLSPLLDPTNSAAVRYQEVENYIKSAFYYLGFTDYSLSPTDFVSHLKRKPHEYIALRLEADCEFMSSLSISPPPVHITRIFVLYKGLSAVDAQIWDIYTRGVDPWGGGVSRHSFSQAGLKVLEIAWMEDC